MESFVHVISDEASFNNVINYQYKQHLKKVLLFWHKASVPPLFKALSKFFKGKLEFLLIR
jgi:DnaJ family protein C protein 16